MTLDRYRDLFARLRRAPGSMWTEDTLHRAPHKPLLLLAVMDLVARGVLKDRFISISGELTELNELFTDYWRSVVPISHVSSIAFPFARLHNEPFWRLVPASGRSITADAVNNVSTVVQLRRLALGAHMDEELFILLQDRQPQQLLGSTLLRTCFSERAQVALNDQMTVHREAFQYSLTLERLAHAPIIKEPEAISDYRPLARDQGFRRIVVATYDHRCALCGTRIITPEGHTAVDAAHIIPWSISKNDDVRNGMALCKLCHWAFDEGLMGVSDSYTVITSRQMNLNQNTAGSLVNLTGRGILGPPDRGLWPAQVQLHWHRKRFKLAV